MTCFEPAIARGLFLDTCIEAKQRFVVDNANPTELERERYLKLETEYGTSFQ